jgi:hypothetical protein
MYIITDEMKSTADYAIKVAKERFKLDLDFSEQSIAKLEDILGQIYWGFSNRTKAEGEDGVIFNTAVIWGSFLGEYMRLKMGGIWILKGSDPLVSIKNIEFSPISLIYQKISNHPEYSVENYINEAKRVINTSVITPQQARYRSENVSQPKEIIPAKPAKKPVVIDKRLIYFFAGIGGILLLTLIFLIGYKLFKPGGVPAIGELASATSATTDASIISALATSTPDSINTPFPTATLSPTYTPKPTLTLLPSSTPFLTDTPSPTSPPTDTATPLVPTRTRTPVRTRIPTPTSVNIPNTKVPTLTSTSAPPSATIPPPTNTQPPPPTIQSCSINPSSVPAGINTQLTFSAQFSAPGYSFEALIQAGWPGQKGCSATDNNGDGTAECNGTSGLVPSSTKVDVVFRSSLGDCVASFSTP